MKVERGVASPSLIPHGEALEVVSAGSGERLRLPRAILGEIIEARMSELFEMSRAAIESAGVQNRLAGGVILTGGGALLPGATELAQQIFDLPVRLGKPIELAGWSDKVDTPQFATGVGLLRFALRQPGTLGNPLATASNPQMAPAMADPERRVWSVRAPSSYLTTAGSEANGTRKDEQPANAAGDATAPAPRSRSALGASYPARPEEAALLESDSAAEAAEDTSADSGQKTPFDRLRGSREERRSSPAPQQTIWQKLVAGLRDLIGLERV